ncbi:DUF805 domain-containing protein [Algibacter pectinivorans]|uniref:Uncharacterized membrane protein YhaH, DUF805 family n=1 Tax=Algibacter pectinivorans TaxID=870482 RepID=A0A1I1RMH2_9FLAO|nr:DUF805 domain-containing protein [Algibacter pectinivorans]SFD35529.1 Uncharacterized membrane protein YhaH, DUF805 family [Algibacter pectinivorans]
MYNYLLKPFIKVFKFKGRSSLKEFWFFILINFLISLILVLTKKYHGIDKIDIYYRYLYIIPLISLGFRRIQDTGKSGFLFLIPFVNIILSALPGEDSKNKYGKPTEE